MTVPDAELRLAAGFPEPTRAAWHALVKGVLTRSGAASEGTPPAAVEDLLTTVTHDGIRIRPLYTAADSPASEIGMPGFAPFARNGRPQGPTTSGWDVRALHTHPDAKTTAQAVLTDLENGVTSLWLTLGDRALPVTAIPDALGDVLLDLAPLALDAGAETASAAAALFALAAERQVPPSSLAGNLGADPLGHMARTGGATTPDLGLLASLAARCTREYPGLRAAVVDALPYHEAGGGDADELGLSIATGVAYLRALTEAGLGVAPALAQLEFRYAASADQFATIAKLRAARRLWSRVAQVCGAPAGARAQRQHAVTSPVMMTRRDPWVNMLRTTLACVGAGIAGADAVTVLPFDAELGLPDDFARRIARNTQTLVQEEANLTRVVDPAGGSWYVESLTDALARAGWAVFTEVERAGGMAAALASGLVGQRLDASWAKRADAVAHRRDALTGLSEFPNLAEVLPTRVPAPARTGAARDARGAGVGAARGRGLPRRRYGEVFEALRDACDAHAAATGARPKVFLATIGPLAAYTARATFAANLFQAGGLDIVDSTAGGLETVDAGPGTDPEKIVEAFRASGAKLACLCSSDAVYAESAAPVARALTDAGAARVWLAGRPGARADTDAAAGVGGYVHAGCDAAGILRTALAEAGVA